ncbi:hypothetical protein ACPA54_15210 [Uniformispora flossi]|uniref:hypothetical protein n=1 Tax=Uniformispora flossi TaxID=3390723 RepID=UPI003C2EA9D3
MKQLIEALATLPPDATVMLVRDPEWNDESPLWRIEQDAAGPGESARAVYLRPSR